MTKTMRNKEKRIKITENIDVTKAVYKAMVLAETAGLKRVEQYMISTAVSELARNILRYAMKGEITVRIIERETKKGIEIVAEDNGPGIEDIGQTLKDNFSTSGGLGLGLSGTKRLMDEFELDTELGRGTKVTARKWGQKNA